MGLFSKTTKDPKTKVNEWSSRLRKERYQLDRQIRTIQREEEKVKRSLKEAAKKGDKDICRALAREIVNSHKAINRIHTSKAHINSIEMQMKGQLATLRTVGALKKSSEVMQAMQQLIKLPEISRTMQELSKEMMTAGILDEMLEDTMDMLQPEVDEQEADQEVDKILFELTEGTLGKAPDKVTDTLPVTEEPNVVADETEEEVEEMRNRLQALRS